MTGIGREDQIDNVMAQETWRSWVNIYNINIYLIYIHIY